MIDEDLGIYLIEANTNPCIEINQCAVLARIIPNMLECAFRIAVDPLLPPPDLNFKRGQEFLSENKFIQVFDYSVEEDRIKKLYQDENEEQENILKEELYEESQDEDDG